MLHLEIAVAPNQVRTLADLSLLEARLGFDKGAVLSCFPSKWFRDVVGNLEGDASQIDRSTERLRRLQQLKLVKFGRQYEGNDWPNSARNSHEASPFHRVIDGIGEPQPHFILDIQQLEDRDFEFNTQFPRDSVSLAKAARALLVDAEKVTLFDNYICPTKANSLKTLVEMMKLCQKAEVELHIFAEEDDKPDRELRNQALDRLRPDIPQNIRLYWYWVHDSGSGYLHQRGMFTGKGGLIYDRGFEEPHDHEQRRALTVITPMPITTLEAKARVFNPAQACTEFNYVGIDWRSHR